MYAGLTDLPNLINPKHRPLASHTLFCFFASQLVANKQLIFVNGGWCMHDEAATHYVGMIDQTTLGHQHLLNEFGADGGIPTVAWQLGEPPLSLHFYR